MTAAGQSILELREVAKHYQSGSELVHAIDGVSLAVEQSSVVALYGPSGSGKTTLLLLAAAMLSPDNGTVRFDGRDLGQMSETEAALYRRRDVGLIHQTFHLISGLSALDNAAAKLLADNVKLGSARKQAKTWMERLGLAHRLDHLPKQLSGGERQRVAIARAIANRPRVILADEPTGNLDTKRGREVLQLLAEVSREEQAAVILVTHDPEALDMADRVHTLRDGRLLLDTRPDWIPNTHVGTG